MKVNSLVIISGIIVGIFALAVLGILLYLALGLGDSMTANPGGLIGGLTLLWASVKTKILNLDFFKKDYQQAEETQPQPVTVETKEEEKQYS